MCARPVATPTRMVGGVLTLAGGSLFAMTLSACYGVADRPDFRDAGGPRPDANSATCSDTASDLDGDGYCGALDCDEADPSIHADAMETAGDGVDSDCDGVD